MESVTGRVDRMQLDIDGMSKKVDKMYEQFEKDEHDLVTSIMNASQKGFSENKMQLDAYYLTSRRKKEKHTFPSLSRY